MTMSEKKQARRRQMIAVLEKAFKITAIKAELLLCAWEQVDEDPNSPTGIYDAVHELLFGPS